MILHEVAEFNLVFLGDDGGEVGFDFVGIGFGGEAEAGGEAGDMAINANAGDGEGVSEEDVGGFATDTGKFEEVFEFFGDCAVIFFGENSAGALDALGFHAATENGAEFLLEFGEGNTGPICGGFVFFEEGWCDFVDHVVAVLGGEDEVNEEFEGIGKIEGELGVGMGLAQEGEDAGDAGLALGNGFHRRKTLHAASLLAKLYEISFIDGALGALRLAATTA